jgi:3-oxoacyl-[acyl-carrier protein] reductase
MTNKYSGSRVLVLGGSCELALGLAKSMLPEGLYPLLTYRSAEGKARIDKCLEDWGGRYASLRVDLSAPDESADLEVLSDAGPDYLVDFAQGDLEGLVASVDGAAIAPFFQANIERRAAIIRLVARTMLTRRSGRMVFVSSVAAERPNAGQGYYAAAKLASEALYRNLGLELAARGITTAILRPGYVNAGRGRRYLNGQPERAMAEVPLKRPLEVAEVVDTIMFLMSDSAVGINAAVVTMDGGLSAGK